MSDHTIHLDDLSDHLAMTDEGADAEWPRDVSIVLDIKWHPAEPDVGIFHSQPEITGTTYYIGADRFTDEAIFVEALYLIIGEWCEEDQDAIAEMVASRIDNEEVTDD